MITAEFTVKFASNCERIKNAISLLKDDAQSVVQCKQIIQKDHLMDELKYIESNFKDLSKTIKYFENQNLKLEDNFYAILNRLKSISGEFASKLAKKIDAVLKRNPDLHILRQFYENDFELQIKYSHYLPYFTYASITSCDVERSFSIFKDVLTSKRTSFTNENLEKVMVIYINNSQLVKLYSTSLSLLKFLNYFH